MTGRRPFSGATRIELFEEILEREPKPPRQIVEDLPPALERLCLACLSKSVTRRPSTTDDVAVGIRRSLPRRGSRRAKKYSPLDPDVGFTAYHPHTVEPGPWHSVLAYAGDRSDLDIPGGMS